VGLGTSRCRLRLGTLVVMTEDPRPAGTPRMPDGVRIFCLPSRAPASRRGYAAREASKPPEWHQAMRDLDEQTARISLIGADWGPADPADRPNAG
jgi:hypothetical protein